MRSLLTKIHLLVESNEAFVLASIIEHSGSTPRSSGARMIIRENGEIFGTIGGGKIEAMVQSEARLVFKTMQPLTQKITFSGADAATF